MNHYRSGILRVAVVLAAALGLGSAFGQPKLVSSDPAIGAAGVGTSKPIVFTFDSVMDTDITQVFFLDMTNPLGEITSTPTWDGTGKVLTCTPNPSWPATKTITWFISGGSIDGQELDGVMGSFTTGSSSGNEGGTTGPGTNKITSYIVGKLHSYVQSSEATPVIDPEMPYGFQAMNTIASNRLVSASSLTIPGGRNINLTRNFIAAENFYHSDFFTNEAQLETAYPAGNYVFSLTETPANTSKTINFRSGLVQPNAPTLLNFGSLQAVDAGKPYTLTWKPFQNGTAQDFIHVQIGTFSTAEFNSTNALRGTATSVIIPAGTLAPGTTNMGIISFYRADSVTNQTDATMAYRATLTEFNLVTSSGGGAGERARITKVVATGNALSFQIEAPVGQTLSVETSSDLVNWSPSRTVTSTTGKIDFSDTIVTTGKKFYRTKNVP